MASVLDNSTAIKALKVTPPVRLFFAYFYIIYKNWQINRFQSVDAYLNPKERIFNKFLNPTVLYVADMAERYGKKYKKKIN
jgi:hypothetical protein